MRSVRPIGPYLYEFNGPKPVRILGPVGFSPQRFPNLAARWDVSNTGSLVLDSSNRISLISDTSGNSSVNTLHLPGVVGNYASTPDSAALDITGDIDLRAHVALNDWTPSAINGVVTKWTVGQASWQFRVNTTGVLQLVWSVDGSAAIVTSSTVAPTVTDIASLWIRATLDVDNGAGGYTVTFFTGGSASTPSWVQLGSTVVGGSTTSIFSGTTPIAIGSIDPGLSPLSGRIYRAQIYSGINGTLVFDANFAAQQKRVTSFTESSSNAATVTINQTAISLPARIHGDRDLYQGLAASQPVYLQFSGENYGYLNAASGNYFSTPDSAANSLTAELDIVIRVTMPTWTPAATSMFAAKNNTTGNQRSWRFGILSTGALFASLSSDGITEFLNTSLGSALGFLANSTYWLRFTFESNVGGNIRARVWYASDTGDNTPPTNWTLHSTNTSVTATTLFDSTAALEIGSHSAGTTNALNALVRYAELRSTIGGNAVNIFNPSLYSSGSTFTASTGETWTLNGTSTIVMRSCAYFDGVDDYMKTSSFVSSQPETIYFVGQQTSWTSGDYILDGNSTNSGALIQTTATPQLNINAGSSVAANTNLALKTLAVISIVFDGASSSLKINKVTKTTGNAGTTSMLGFILGASGASSPANHGNFSFNESLVYTVAHDDTTRDQIISGLANKWGITL